MTPVRLHSTGVQTVMTLGNRSRDRKILSDPNSQSQQRIRTLSVERTLVCGLLRGRAGSNHRRRCTRRGKSPVTQRSDGDGHGYARRDELCPVRRGLAVLGFGP